MMNAKKLTLFGLLFFQQAFGSSCDFRVSKAQVFSVQKNYNLKISFLQACSKDSFYKRDLVSPKFELFKGDKLLTVLRFSKGYWLESAQKYHFKDLTDSRPECPHLRDLTLDLEKDYITSLTGNYLNLNKETLVKWPCSL